MTAWQHSANGGIAGNLAAVRERIAQAARRSGRDADAVTLVAVSKTKPLAAVMEAYAAGQRLFGENRVQEALPKLEQSPADTEWHMIGHLQTNKARQIPGAFSTVQSVDSEKLARALSKHVPKGDTLDIMLQLNWSHEASKAGIADEDGLRQVLEAVLPLPGLRLTGLMTIPDPDYSEAQTRRCFADIRGLHGRMRQEFGLGEAFRELSMGMTHDFEWAIEEGATVVRVGTAIFGARP
jgi:hypothetical protein